MVCAECGRARLGAFMHKQSVARREGRGASRGRGLRGGRRKRRGDEAKEGRARVAAMRLA